MADDLQLQIRKVALIRQLCGNCDNGRPSLQLVRKHTKTYPLGSLLCSKKNLQQRVEQINLIGQAELTSVPPVTANLHHSEVSVSQDLIIVMDRSEYHHKEFADVAAALQFFSDIGFVHGDINRRNVPTTRNGFSILDFEPCLKQLDHGRVKTMATVPYISNTDKLRNQISTLTDKLGFFYFVKRVLGTFRPRDIVDLSKSNDHSKYLGFSEKDLVDISYSELLSRAEIQHIATDKKL